jgi:hypothetical protein
MHAGVAQSSVRAVDESHGQGEEEAVPECTVGLRITAAPAE